MVSVLNVNAEQIHRIKSPEQLVELLRRLLHAEARANGIARRGISVPAQITVSDGGEDARIDWQNGPDATDYLPARVSMFQSKAKSMPKSSCASEVKNTDNSLKSAIRDTLDANGAYIVFCTDKCGGKMLRERIAGICEGLAAASGNRYPNAAIDFYDANKISDWINSHPSVAAWALTELFGRPVSGLQSWESWSRNPDLKAQSFGFIAGSSIDGRVDLRKVMEEVPAHLSNPRAVARIVGLSGLGKTRVALEMFRPPADRNDAVRSAETASVIYTSAQIGKENLHRLFHDLRAEQLHGIVVVDDCDLELHRTLTQIVQHPQSNLSLLTLDYDPAAISGTTHYVELGRFDDETIKGILKQAYPGLKDPDIGRICVFAQGFPLMAVLLGEASLSDEGHVVTLQDDVVLNRLVWGRDQKDDVGHRVLAACSLFENVGVEGRVKPELEFVAQSICNITWQECFQWIQRFERRQLIQRRGDYIQVLPKPLALRLAGERWSELHPDEAKAWFSGVMPERMLTTLCDQLAKLDFHPSAKALVDNLCGPSGPFANPEVLNTETGSRCFRSLVETNPDATVSALEHAFGSWSTEQLLTVQKGRRHLVWALEKLCFRRETFHRAAKMLLAFAAAENETWGNNATGQFVHLFQLLLSGTEATGDEKLSVIDDALESDDSKRVHIAINALGNGLITWHFSRVGGTEEQGSGRRLEDWQPTQKEARDYLKNVLTRLTAIAAGDSEFAYLAREKIAANIRSMANSGLLDELIIAIDKVMSRHGSYWVEALDGVSDILQYDTDKLPPNVIANVKALYDRLLPQSLEDRLRFYVTDLPWDFFLGSEKKEETETVINSLAEECARDVEYVLTKLPVWFVGSHRQFYAFGRRLGQVFPEPNRFIMAAFDFLKTTDSANVSASFLGAFLTGMQSNQPQLVQRTLDEVASEPALQRYLVDLTRFVSISPVEIDRVVEILRARRITPSEVRLLAYGSVLSTLSPEQIDPLLGALLEVGGEGIWVALDIAAMYLHGGKERGAALINRIETLLKVPGLLSEARRSVSDDYHFEVLAKLILENEDSGAQLAVHLASEIVAVCKLNSFPYNRDHLIKKLMAVIFAKYPRDAWPAFRDTISANDPLTKFHLEHVLGAGFDKGEGPAGVLLTHYTESQLLEWCRENPDSTPAFLASIVPLLTQGEHEGQALAPLVRKILDKFGDRKGVVVAISRNMHTFSSVGSLVPYYQRYVKPMESLLKHRHKAVRDFARAELVSLKANIEREAKRDQEHDFGIY